MKTRGFREEDTEAVITLWKRCGLTRSWNDPAKDIRRKLSVQPELFLVGEIDGKVMATAMAGYDGHRGYVYYLAVAPEYQNLGYGGRLMQEVETLLTARGCPKLNILVRTGNKEVLDFYEKLGYVPDEVESLGKRTIPD